MVGAEVQVSDINCFCGLKWDGKNMKLCLMGLVIIITAGMFCGFAGAEESGSGHYLPGATSSFIDMLPDSGTSTFAYLNAFTYYHGSTGASRDLELGGQVAANVKGTVYADTSIFLYQAPWTLLGGQYGAAVAVPYVWMNVKGNLLLTTRRGRTFGREAQGTDNSFGDIELLPLMFGWKEGDLKWQGTFGIYAPTGDFKKGALANVGTNYWTFEPGAAASYLSSKYGFELTAFTGFDFNTENGTTNYQTGDQFYLDGTLAQHLPLFGGFVGVGANGFFYQQITGDSGSGAKLGGFEGMTAGVGPAVSYAYSVVRLGCGRRIQVAAGNNRVESAERKYSLVQAGGQLGREPGRPAPGNVRIASATVSFQSMRPSLGE